MKRRKNVQLFSISHGGSARLRKIHKSAKTGRYASGEENGEYMRQLGASMRCPLYQELALLEGDPGARVSRLLRRYPCKGVERLIIGVIQDIHQFQVAGQRC